MNTIREYSISKIDGDNLDKIIDKVIVEYLFTIFIDDEEYITLMCTPKSLKSLTIGFLHSESIIESTEDIEEILLFKEKGYINVKLKNRVLINTKLKQNRIITSGCGKGSIYYNELDKLRANIFYEKRELQYENILRLMKYFNKSSSLFLETGGVHSVALINSKEIIFFEEDIGRHNAIDKIIGRCLENGITVEDKVILTSGRITSEIVLKCAKLNIKCIVSRSAVTNKAIELATIVNMTLIGFARGNKMNIYT